MGRGKTYDVETLIDAFSDAKGFKRPFLKKMQQKFTLRLTKRTMRGWRRTRRRKRKILV